MPCMRRKRKRADGAACSCPGSMQRPTCATASPGRLGPQARHNSSPFLRAISNPNRKSCRAKPICLQRWLLFKLVANVRLGNAIITQIKLIVVKVTAYKEYEKSVLVAAGARQPHPGQRLLLLRPPPPLCAPATHSPLQQPRRRYIFGCWCDQRQLFQLGPNQMLTARRARSSRSSHVRARVT